MGSIARERRGVNVKTLFAAGLADAQAAAVQQLGTAVEQKLERQLDVVSTNGVTRWQPGLR